MSKNKKDAILVQGTEVVLINQTGNEYICITDIARHKYAFHKLQVMNESTPTNLHPVMFAGTGSEVGKSVIAAAFCRIFRQDGYRPAPSKAQNMSLNSYPTPEGLDIGRAQAVQAEAAGIESHTDMNPLLLKPSAHNLSQVVLNGQAIGNQSACDYFRKEGRERLRREVNDAFDRLAQRYNPIVMEGAGSLAEINLREVDLVNLPMAMYAGARVILVADRRLFDSGVKNNEMTPTVL